MSALSQQDRVDELRLLLESTGEELGALGLSSFSDFHKRATELMEREVWTHEFAYPDYLYHEILTGTSPTMEGIVAKLPEDKLVILVTDETD